MSKVTELYAFLGKDPSGEESVVGVSPGPDSPIMVPLVSKKLEDMEQYKPFAKKFAEATKSTVVLARFAVRSEIEVIR